MSAPNGNINVWCMMWSRSFVFLQDRSKMYTVGSLFYAIYFFVSFPMFFRIDEVPGKRRWTASETALDALAASMLVTIVLDLWRISFGNIYGGPENTTGLPWMQ